MSSTNISDTSAANTNTRESSDVTISTANSLFATPHTDNNLPVFSLENIKLSLPVATTIAGQSDRNKSESESKLSTWPFKNFKFCSADSHGKIISPFCQSTTISFKKDDLIIESASCDVCSQDFSEIKSPKVLDCGHSICSECLVSFLECKKNCPNCNKSMLKSSVEEYPTNFHLLSLSDSIRKFVRSEHHIIYSLDSLKTRLVTKKDMLIKNIGEQTFLKNTIENDIERIDQMMNLDKESLVLNEANNLIQEVRGNLEKAEKILNCCLKPVVKKTYSLDQYRNSQQFLYELSIRLYKRESIYACNLVEDKLKYGKIDFQDGKLFVHALTSFTVNKNASIVSLRDLKKCLTLDNFFVFIKLGIHMLHFKLVNSSVQALQFIKLCTGETGPVLQGSSILMKKPDTENMKDVYPNSYFVTQGQIQSSIKFGTTVPTSTFPFKTNNQQLEFGKNIVYGNIKNNRTIVIPYYMTNSINTIGYIDYDLSVFCNQPEKEFAGIVLQSFPQGKFHIYQCKTKQNCKDIIGVLHNDQTNFDSVSATSVDDCGILFQF